MEVSVTPPQTIPGRTMVTFTKDEVVEALAQYVEKHRNDIVVNRTHAFAAWPNDRHRADGMVTLRITANGANDG